MKEKELKHNIDTAVKIFRQMLEKTYLDNKTPFYGIGQHNLMDFFGGNVSFTRLKNGNLKISGEVPKVALKDDVAGLPRKFDDWKIFPVVITLFHYPGIFTEEWKNPKNKTKK